MIDDSCPLGRLATIDDVANAAWVWQIDRTIVYQGAKYKDGNLQGVSANYAAVTNLVRRLHDDKKIVGAICHAGSPSSVWIAA